MKNLWQTQKPDSGQVAAQADSIVSDTVPSIFDTVAVEFVYDAKSIVNIDSILWKQLPPLSSADSATLGVFYRESLVKGTFDKSMITEPEVKNIVKQDFIIYALVFVFGLLAVSRYFDRQKFKNYLWGLFRKKEFEKFLRDDGFAFLPPNLIWFSLTCFVNALFFQQSIKQSFSFLWDFKDPVIVGILILAFAIVFLIKGISIWTIGRVFNTEKAAAVHTLIFYNSVFIISIVEFILLTLRISDFGFSLQFSTEIIGIGFVASLVYITLQLLFGIRFKNLQDILYFILYLCTLEYLPFIALGFGVIKLN